ncbi:hypothetical protein HK096_008069, partial [Nowakowskiella sp. JEL0078]
MDTILERQRSLHEEIDRIEQAIVNELLAKQRTHKDTLIQEHRVRKLLDQLQASSRALKNLYKDPDGSRALKAEIAEINTGSDLSPFYNRLSNVREYHRKYPNEMAIDMSSAFKLSEEDIEREEEELDSMFTAEEVLGRYLDLHSLFDQYFTLKQGKKITYLDYLNDFGKFDGFSKTTKMTPKYRDYLSTLLIYLESYMTRSQPMYNLAEFSEQVLTNFENDWKDGKCKGWERQSKDADEPMHSALHCPACQKDFTSQGVYTSHLAGKRHLKAAKTLLESSLNNPDLVSSKSKKPSDLSKEKEICKLEILITAYFEKLSSQREETKSKIENKQVLGDSEKLDDDEIVLSENGDSDSDIGDDPDKIYNPLKLPLGWDGKPIPYWLYKLHGLGVPYDCEICGGYVYMGRKAFDKHFQEWRHAHGMRCLGIPNSRHFQDITGITDAYALYERLKSTQKVENFIPDAMEEFEDSEGN